MIWNAVAVALFIVGLALIALYRKLTRKWSIHAVNDRIINPNERQDHDYTNPPPPRE